MCSGINLGALNTIISHHSKMCKVFNSSGGENWGTTPLSQYSWAHVDLKAEAVWCPTTSNHSGKS